MKVRTESSHYYDLDTITELGDVVQEVNASGDKITTIDVMRDTNAERFPEEGFGKLWKVRVTS